MAKLKREWYTNEPSRIKWTRTSKRCQMKIVRILAVVVGARETSDMVYAAMSSTTVRPRERTVTGSERRAETETGGSSMTDMVHWG